MEKRVPARSSRGRRFLAMAAMLVMVCLLVPARSHAQEWTRITGRVTGPDGAPLPQARVQATGADGQRVEARPDASGTYRLRLAGRTFVISAEAPGMSPATRIAERPGDASDLVLDLTLDLRSVTLDPVIVQAQPLTVAAATAWVPGSSDRSRAGIDLRAEPLGADLLSELTERKPGIASVATPVGLGISILGQSPTQTRLTVDGADAGAAAVPREAVRSVSVLGNTYDVGRGRFTGGQVEIRTQRAGNEWGASLRVDGTGPRLQYAGSPGTASTTGAVDAGGGGALVRDRLFIHGGFALRGTRTPAPAVSELGAEGLARIGLDPDSVHRFLELTRPWHPAAGGVREAGFVLGTGLLRMDAILSPGHTLLLRATGQGSRFELLEAGTAVRGTGTGQRRDGWGVLAQHSLGGERVAHELRVSVAGSSRRGTAADPSPEGIVAVASTGAPGGAEWVDLRFAGSGLDPRTTRERSLDLSEQVVLTTADERHRLRAGAELGVQEHERTAARDAGRFTFASLDDLREGRVATFTRVLEGDGLDVTSRRAAFFLDDHWSGPGFHLSYGVRGERAWYSDRTRAAPEVEATFGRAPGEVPSPWRLSPRVGFAFDTRMPWDRGPHGQTSIQGGFGEFVGEMPLSLLGAALAQGGRAEDAELVCIAAAAPVTDWDGYRRDPSIIPTTCADGSTPFSSRLPPVTLFSSSYSPPRVWRGSVEGQGVLPDGIVWNLSVSVLRGIAQPVAFDRNLRGEPAFRNDAERGRPVYAAPSAVDPHTGAVSLGASRQVPGFGVVREITGTGASRAVQVAVSGNQTFGRVGRIGWLYAGAGYAWTWAEETVGPASVPGGGFASTAGDGSRAEWAPAGYGPRHQFQLYGGLLRSRRLTLGFVGSLSSGAPFTPLVTGDANGDGLANDRAFVFDPEESGVDGGVRAGMQALLGTAPAGARECLRAQRGRVAGHNSCRAPWTHALDLNARLQFGPALEASPHKRLSVWIVARNVTAGLDQLLHGQEGLRGWGQPGTVDSRLLTVRGFDPVSRTFRYEVNPRFGSRGAQAALQRAPFTVSLQLRVVLGTDRALREFYEARDANSNRMRALAPANVRLHLDRQLPNAPAAVLALNAPSRLYLDPAQAIRLSRAADSLAPAIERVSGGIVAIVAIDPRIPPRPVDAGALRRLVAEAVAVRTAGIAAVREILTPDQWMMLPAELRDPSPEFQPYPTEQVHVSSPR